MSRLIVDAAFGLPWDYIGAEITSEGLEDSSGLRRAIMSSLTNDDVELYLRLLPYSSSERFDELQQLVRSWYETQRRDEDEA